jgi:hypothetical protein
MRAVVFSSNGLSTLVYRDITPRGAVILIIDFATEPAEPKCRVDANNGCASGDERD